MSNATDIKDATEELLDSWTTNMDGPVALRLRQRLEPVEASRIVFPPTYADIGYNVDVLSDGSRVATIDSVGSQANRLEPLFKSSSTNPDDWLVPQIDIVIRKEDCGECEACERNAAEGKGKKSKKVACQHPRFLTRSLLDLAHRAADAVVLSSPDLLRLVAPAFKKLQKGDAGPLCAIAPTSLVFGVWDSRGDTGEKRPRLVRSVIRAWDVEVLHAAAQFNSVWKVLDEEQRSALQNEAKKQKTDLSEHGLKDAPATFRKTKAPQYRDGAPNPEARVLGGVRVNDRVEREVTVNLVALRGLRGATDDETKAIRKYLFGLSLVAATADCELYLREGCLLRHAENGETWEYVPRRGEPAAVALSADLALRYARKATEHFRAKWADVFGGKWRGPNGVPELKYEFSLEQAKQLLAKKDEEESTPSE